MTKTLNRQILERAVQIWKDPKKRCKGRYYDNGQYCALGVLGEAFCEVHGIKSPFSRGLPYAQWPSQLRHFVNDEASRLLGYRSVVETNDRLPGGQDLLFKRMLETLEKDL